MSDFGSWSQDPDLLQKLLDARNKAPTQEAVQAAEGNNSQADMYRQLFQKQATQDMVDQMSSPGNTAADSAQVLQNAPELPSNPQMSWKDVWDKINPAAESSVPEAAPVSSSVAEAGAALGDGVGSDALTELLGHTARLGSKAMSAPAAAAMAFLDSKDTGKGEDKAVEDIRSGKTKPMFEKEEADHSNDPSDDNSEDPNFEPDEEAQDLLDNRGPAEEYPEGTDGSDVGAAKAIGPSGPIAGAPAAEAAPETAAPYTPNPDISSYQNLINSIYDPEELKKAYAQKRQDQGLAQMMLGANQIGAGLARNAIKADELGPAMMMREANIPVEQLEAQQRNLFEKTRMDQVLQEMKDKDAQRNPNSELSKTAVNFMAANNVHGIIPGMSYEAVKMLVPSIDTILKSKIIQEQYRMHLMDKQDAKERDMAQKAPQQLATIVNRGALSDANKSIAQSDKLIGLLQDPDLGAADITKLDKASIAKIHAIDAEAEKLFGGGVATQSGKGTFVPETLSARIAAAKQKVMGGNPPANVGSILAEILPMAQDIKEQAQAHIGQQLSYPLTGLSKFFVQNPDYYTSIRNDPSIKKYMDSYDKYRGTPMFNNTQVGPPVVQTSTRTKTSIPANMASPPADQGQGSQRQYVPLAGANSLIINGMKADFTGKDMNVVKKGLQSKGYTEVSPGQWVREQ